MFCDQSNYRVRCEWGMQGVHTLAPVSDVVVIVDVLSFSTAVDVANARGVEIFPYPHRDASAPEFANSHRAHLAEPRDPARYSLSPASLQQCPPGTRLVLPSPNGSALSLATGRTATLCGCLRNSRAVAAHAATLGSTIAVIPAGERWPDGSLRPAIEDLLGAGAIVYFLNGTKSPEAAAAESAFITARESLADAMLACASGRQLLEMGYAGDVQIASKFDCSSTVPALGRTRSYGDAAGAAPDPA